MRTILYPMLLAVAVAALPNARAAVHASASETSNFSWSDAGRGLGLHSHNGSGVIVTRATPEPFQGLRRGDVLEAAGGKPLRHVDDLARLLRGRTAPITLQVRRGNALVTLTWSQADFHPFAPPPPAPPPPPRP